MALIIKIIAWIKANGASIIGCLQALIKAVKELLTAVLNLLSIFFPAAAIQRVIEAVRDFLNKIDGWLELAKPYLLNL
jgi:hypothetical protein